MADLARAVVQVVAVVDGGEDSLGSGTIVSADGLILTNAHVVTPEEGSLDAIEIGITDASDAPPEPTYRAEVAAADGALDLAILRITDHLDGGPVPDEFPFVTLGDSDTLDIGDPLRILGYPGIGGETITLTSGEVSGFVSEAGLGRRAWIKTDATIAGGNSGGLAANADGELIAIPTIAGATDEVVDCRPVRDTNRDGRVNDDDDCVPIGGFLNGLRPVALAMDMIDAVSEGLAYEPIAPAEPAASGGGSIEDVFWSDPTFGHDIDATDGPVGEALFFEPDITSLCAFWDYEGMRPGLRWSAEWWVDGSLDREGSFLDERWTQEESGRFWICLDDEEGVGPGLYDVAFLVEGEPVSTGSVHVGEDIQTGNVTVRNDGDEPICYLFAAPPEATVWGVDRLGDETVLVPGGSISFDLVHDVYDFSADDCDFEPIFEERITIDRDEHVLVWNGIDVVATDDSLGPTDLAVGDCLDGEVGWTRRSTEVVPCSEPHQRQIVGITIYESADEEFPGEDALNEVADEHCLDAFERFIGISYERSRYYLSTWSPSPESWGAGDRLIVCTAEMEDESDVTGSLEGVRE